MTKRQSSGRQSGQGTRVRTGRCPKPSLQRDGESLSTNRTADARRHARRRSAERRDAILAAALEEFSARGFEATRLDDVARRANVAKGTIYLYFADKETLFQELIRMVLEPAGRHRSSTRARRHAAPRVADRLVDLFVREIFGTRRKDVIRLIITEGPRFPKLAEFYYREVISRVMAAMRAHPAPRRRARRAQDRRADRFPQLLVAPGLVAIDLERPVRPFRAARRARDDARALRHVVRQRRAP